MRCVTQVVHNAQLLQHWGVLLCKLCQLGSIELLHICALGLIVDGRDRLVCKQAQHTVLCILNRHHACVRQLCHRLEVLGLLAVFTKLSYRFVVLRAAKLHSIFNLLHAK